MRLKMRVLPQKLMSIDLLKKLKSMFDLNNLKNLLK